MQPVIEKKYKNYKPRHQKSTPSFTNFDKILKAPLPDLKNYIILEEQKKIIDSESLKNTQKMFAKSYLISIGPQLAQLTGAPPSVYTIFYKKFVKKIIPTVCSFSTMMTVLDEMMLNGESSYCMLKGSIPYYEKKPQSKKPTKFQVLTQNSRKIEEPQQEDSILNEVVEISNNN